MTRLSILTYGVLAYAAFLCTFLYLIGFVSGLGVPVTIDTGGPSASLVPALAIDLGLILLFGLQHCIMARPGFKAALTRYLPPSIERSTFVLVTCGVLALLYTQWRPIPAVVWSLTGPLADVLLGVAFAGWGLVLLSTFVIDHFDLFGLRQVWLRFRGVPYTKQTFRERIFYRWVRHPLMLGFLVAFWATPRMTVGHLVFALGFTTFVLVALRFEEADLVAEHGAAYRDYQRRVPKLLPLGRPADGRTAVEGA